jgi:tetratricopeptide (TPR) repeat protein
MDNRLQRVRPAVAGVVAWATLTTAGSNRSATPPALAVLVDGLGTYSRPISAASPAAQRFFDQGLRLVYGYYFREAAASFQEAQRQDANHPMIYWGLALAIGPSPNSRFLGFPDDPRGDGRKAIAGALARAAAASPVERALIESLAVRYDIDRHPDRDTRDARYIQSTAALHQRYPDDPEAGFMYADAVMTHAAWNYWRRDGSPLPGTLDTASALERVMSRQPGHPGAVHLYVHLFESSKHPERALPQANQLESLMPLAGHMVHMPSHIYVRVGEYDKAVASNQRSLAADRSLVLAWGDHPLPENVTYGNSARTHAPHAWDMMRYAATLQGNYRRAIEAARAAAGGPSHQGGGSAHRRLAAPWLVHKVFGKWDQLLAEPAPSAESPYLDGLWRYARGSAFSARGDLAAAHAERERLRLAARDPAMAGHRVMVNPASTILEMVSHALDGELALGSGRASDAVTAFSAAVRLQETLSYVEPPDWGQSMRLYLGAALLRAGRPGEAETIYRDDLREFPENGWALFGLGQSLQAQGRTGEAGHVRDRFERAWKAADVSLTGSVF